MEILTPIQSILLTIKKRLTEEDFFTLQKEFINVYAEGFFDARHSKKQLKKSLIESNLLKDFNNENLEKWVRTVCE